MRSARNAPIAKVINNKAAAEGWNLVNPRSIHRRAPLTSWPSGITATSMSTATP